MEPQRLDENVLQFNLVIDNQDLSYPVIAHRRRAIVPLDVAGNAMRTIVPFEISLSISIEPPCSSTMRRQIASPRPVPRPSGLVVKNGSQIFLRSSGATPA